MNAVRRCMATLSATSAELHRQLELPTPEDFKRAAEEQSKELHYDAFVRALNVMLKNKSIKDRLVPIIADEARTFAGMKVCSVRLVSTARTASSTPRSNRGAGCLLPKKTRKARFCRKVSTSYAGASPAGCGTSTAPTICR